MKANLTTKKITIKKYICYVCKRKWPCLNTLKAHRKKCRLQHGLIEPSKDIRLTVCLGCCWVFPQAKSYWRHVSRTGCPKKRRAREKSERWRDKLERLRDKKNIECEFCSKVFETFVSWKSHVRYCKASINQEIQYLEEQKKCNYYKCDSTYLTPSGISLHPLPNGFMSKERQIEFLRRMNIASFETRIPEIHTLRICSKHFSPDDKSGKEKEKKLTIDAVPFDWRGSFSREQVEEIEAHISFREGDDIMQFIKDQRALYDGKAEIELDFMPETELETKEVEISAETDEFSAVVEEDQADEIEMMELPEDEAGAENNTWSKPLGNLIGMENLEEDPQDTCSDVQELRDSNGEVALDEEWKEEMIAPKHKICRVCGEEKPYMVSIFEPGGTRRFLADKINSIFPIRVERTDELPLQVCMTCIGKVDLVCKIFSKVSEVDCLLKSRYATVALPSSPFPSRIQTGDDASGSENESAADIGCEVEEQPASPEIINIEEPEEPNALSEIENVLETYVDPLREANYDFLFCSKCNLTIESASEYIDHYKIEHKKSLSHCPLCSVFFSSADMLRQHWSQLHSRHFTAAIKSPQKLRALPLVASDVRHKVHKDVWICKYCKGNFSDIFIYRKHLQEERNKLKPVPVVFKCDHCDETFDDGLQKTFHQLQHAAFECFECKKKFKTKDMCKVHEETHKASKLLCNVCGKVCKRRSELVTHMRSHDDCVPCEFCSKPIKPNSMKIHLRRVHKETNFYMCSKCGDFFLTNNLLSEHMEKHKELTFFCNQCSFSTNVEDHYDLHLHTMHVDKKQIPCAVLGCNLVFADNRALYEHACEAHSKKEGKIAREIEPGTDGFFCRYCETAFSHPNRLATHIRKDHADIQTPVYMCSLCDETSESVHVLSNHLEVHPECMRFTCQQCPKKFTTSIKRGRHEFSKHFRVTKQCPHCAKIIQASLYNDHLNLHSGDRPYECPTCKKRFSSKRYWSAHLEVHMRTVPYKCEICDEGFRTKQRLVTHSRLHKAEKSFQCDQCNFGCLGRQTMRRHIIREHDANVIEEYVEEQPLDLLVMAMDGADIPIG